MGAVRNIIIMGAEGDAERERERESMAREFYLKNPTREFYLKNPTTPGAAHAA